MYIIVYLWLSGRKNKEISNSGWKLIIAGFSFMSIGYNVDVLDDIWFFENYIWSTILGTFFETVGDVVSFVLLGLGIIIWIPTVTSSKRLQSEVEEHRVTQGELEKKTSILSGLLNSMPDMVFFKDENGNYMGCNPAFSKHVSLPQEDIKGKTDHELFHDEKATYFCNMSREIMATGEDKRYEECIDGSNGRIFIETIKAPLFNKDGNCIGIVGISRDITAMKEANELLRTRVTEEAANKAKNEFFASMSHELRTPLTSIIGYSEILSDGIAGDLNEQQRAYITNIYNSGNHLLRLINDILDLSKIEAGKMELDAEEFGLSDTFNETASIIRSLALKKRINLSFDVDEKLQTITADKLRFKQIIYNLVSNAIKFTPEGGKVEVSAIKASDMVRITVKDNGIGISREDQKRLFQPFEQINSIHLNEGTGLGLSIVKKYVEMHKGKVWVESEPGKGSSFVFELPLNMKEKM